MTDLLHKLTVARQEIRRTNALIDDRLKHAVEQEPGSKRQLRLVEELLNLESRHIRYRRETGEAMRALRQAFHRNQSLEQQELRQKD